MKPKIVEIIKVSYEQIWPKNCETTFNIDSVAIILLPIEEYISSKTAIEAYKHLDFLRIKF